MVKDLQGLSYPKVEVKVNLVLDLEVLHFESSILREVVNHSFETEDNDPLLPLLEVQKEVVAHSHLSVRKVFLHKPFLPMVPMVVVHLLLDDSHDSDTPIHLSLLQFHLYW